MNITFCEVTATENITQAKPHFETFKSRHGVVPSAVMKHVFGIHCLANTAIAALFALAGLFVCLSNAHSATIAISLPLSGDYAQLGKSFRTGAEFALKQSGENHKLVFLDDACDVDFGAMAANDIAGMKPDLVMGFLCNEPAIETATRLSGNDIPILVSNARSTRLIKDRDREQWNIWRMAPGDDYPVARAAATIAELWKNVPYAIVDDGTIYGRSLTDQLRFKMDELGLKPQFSDTFRAAQSTQAGLLRRLQRSGVNAVFVGSASIEDLLTIAGDMAALDVNIDLITTEALLALPYLEDARAVPENIKIVAWPEPNSQIFKTLPKSEETGSGYLLHQGFASMEIALQALAESPRETSKNLETLTFSTILGPISFSGDGAADFNPYRTLTWNGKVFVPLKEVTETQ
ncbi:MAG: ABC transporter substrate-binding protein [Pseudomonadota bacterium]